MKNRLLTVLLILAASGVLAVAQHDHTASTSSTKQSSEDSMQACRKHGSESMAALDKLERTIAAGRESNDPAKMKAALDRAQTELAEAKHHMSMCPMMSGSAMQHGGMDHMKHHDMSGQKNPPDPTNTPK